MKEEERRAFSKYSYFKLKEKYPEDISEFDSDKKIEVRRADTTSDKTLKFAQYPHEV